MRPLTISMARAANLTLEWVRALSMGNSRRPQYGDCIMRTLDAYRRQPISHDSALSPRSVEHAD